MDEYFHSVKLVEDKCKGCTNCIKRCPTEAIRVRKSKARIIDERCIDCGECIRVCPYHAKNAITDPLELIDKYKYKVAIPAPALYGQYNSTFSRNQILTALKLLGFNKTFEVAKAAEIVTEAAKKLIKNHELKKPAISSACPAVVRLIQVRFPNLIDNIVKLESPMEVAAKVIKSELVNEKSISPEDIGVFFISPCAAKVTSVKAPYERKKSFVDGVISIKDIYLKILVKLKTISECDDLIQAGFEGIGWANSGGESSALGTEKYLAVDGIQNVIKILEEIENDRLEDIDFVEALACTGGCLGGPLAVENPYVAKTNLKRHIDESQQISKSNDKNNESYEDLLWTENMKHKPIMKLDQDMEKALQKMDTLEKINSTLPGLDCGACGAPSCHALAEDIVRGNANVTDCIFKLRDKVRNLAMQMMELEAKMPPVLDKDLDQYEKKE